MVKHAWDYKYSSVKYRIKEIKEDNLLSNYKMINEIKDYKVFLEENTDSTFVREKTHTGKPCGNKIFYEKIKEKTVTDYRSIKSGPKVKNDN